MSLLGVFTPADVPSGAIILKTSGTFYVSSFGFSRLGPFSVVLFAFPLA